MLFSGLVKMADAVLRNYTLVSLLPRFDIWLEFGEKSIVEVCRKYGVNEAFFVMVCNVHTFDEYKQEIVNHFDSEEQTVFPYVLKLAEGRTSVDYHIDLYEETHTNIDHKLDDLRNIIIKYLPESCSPEVRTKAGNSGGTGWA